MENSFKDFIKGVDFPDTLLAFHIEKASQGMYEAGKAKGTAYVSYLLLQFLVAVLIFGSADDDKATVPFLQLSVDKYNAAALIMIISFGTLYWWQTTALHDVLLKHKLLWLLAKRHKACLGGDWHLEYPQIFLSTGLLIHSQTERGHHLVARIQTLFSLMIIFLLPFFYTWMLASRLSLSIAIKVGLCALALLLLIPAYIAFYAFIRMSAKSAYDALLILEREGHAPHLIDPSGSDRIT